ncbi:hypothetical protein ABRP83_09410 [Pectobacterium brasiliense]|uniref:hypothetical protein n=1 Tax=Pectobacterium brasiliense TaxID=180957 RepID=UPI0032EDBE30
MSKLIKIKYLILISLFISILPLIVYFINFQYRYIFDEYLTFITLSKKNDIWGSFGSYLSGVLGSLLSFSGLLAVLYSLHLTQKNNLEQSRLLRDERFTTEFNLLTDVLVDLLNNKKYPEVIINSNDSVYYLNYIFNKIENKFKVNKQHINIHNYKTHLITFIKETMKSENVSFERESSIFSTILERLRLSSESLREAFILILQAKINESILLLLYSYQITGNIDLRGHRLVGSEFPLQIPEELDKRIKALFE